MSSDSEDDFFYTNTASMLKALKKDISFSEEKNAPLDINDDFNTETITIDDKHSPIKKLEPRTDISFKDDDVSKSKYNDSCVILSDDELVSSSVNLISKIDSVLVNKKQRSRSSLRNKSNIKGRTQGRKSVSTSRRTTRQNASLLEDDVPRINDSLEILSDDDLPIISRIDCVLVSGKQRNRSISRKKSNNRGKGRGRKNSLTPRKTRQCKRISNNFEILHVDNISTPHKNISDTSTIDDLQESNYEVVIKVLWMSQYVKKFSIRRFDKIQAIFKHFSEIENTPENKLIFTIEKDGVILSKNDTPDSLNINAATIIEGGIKSTEKDQSNVTSKQDKDCIEIKVQLKDKKRPLKITMRRTDRMEVLMHKTATELDVKVNSLKFYFDGDLIKSNDTVDDLQLEGGECIDCIKV